jgi:hypothetical protein
MLYKIPKKSGNVYEVHDGLRLIKEFKQLEDNSYGDKKMRFVMMVADYQSPLKQHPEPRRRELAALEAGWIVQGNAQKTIDARGKKLVDGKDKLVESAIKKYRAIQHNEDRELLGLYDKHIDNIKKTVSQDSNDPDELKKRNLLLESIPSLKRSKNELAALADIKDIMVEEDENEGRELSLIDEIALDESNMEPE